MTIKNKNLSKFTFLNLLLIFIVVLTYSSLEQKFGNSFSLSFAQRANTTTSDANTSFTAENHAVLSLIPLMIKEMANTNATSIPIKQVINATPSNVTALQNLAKNNIINKLDQLAIINQNGSGNNSAQNNSSINISNGNSSMSNNNNNSFVASVNKTKSLIPLIVNMTKKTNATDIALAKTINATPSNVTALQNLAKNNIVNKLHNITSDTLNLANSKRALGNQNGSGNNSAQNNSSINISNGNSSMSNNNNNSFVASVNKTKSLIPLIVNMTKKTNATDIALAKTINATPSNVTALQNLAKNNIVNKLHNISNELPIQP